MGTYAEAGAAKSDAMLGRLLRMLMLMLLSFELLMGLLLLELAAILGAGTRLLRLANCTGGLEGLCQGAAARAAAAGSTGLGGSWATVGAGAAARMRLLCKPRMLRVVQVV